MNWRSFTIDTVDQIDDCRDISGLFYILAFQKGYLINWDVQKTVWDYIFGQGCCAVDFSNPLIVTEPQFNFSSIQEAMTEIFFEEYECESLFRTTAGKFELTRSSEMFTICN